MKPVYILLCVWYRMRSLLSSTLQYVWQRKQKYMYLYWEKAHIKYQILRNIWLAEAAVKSSDNGIPFSNVWYSMSHAYYSRVINHLETLEGKQKTWQKKNFLCNDTCIHYIRHFLISSILCRITNLPMILLSRDHSEKHYYCPVYLYILVWPFCLDISAQAATWLGFVAEATVWWLDVYPAMAGCSWLSGCLLIHKSLPAVSWLFSVHHNIYRGLFMFTATSTNTISTFRLKAAWYDMRRREKRLLSEACNIKY
jgi:hypothetical protein